MDSDITKSDWTLLMMIFFNGLRIIFQLRMLKKQIKDGQITKENLDTSSPVTTLLKLDRYVSELLDRFKKRY